MQQAQIYDCLKKIADCSETVQPALGVLTADGRDAWAKNYQLLNEDPTNQANVEEIRKSLFLVCLDGDFACDEGDNRQTVAGKQLIHGGGSKGWAGNRWYDKTVQVSTSTCDWVWKNRCFVSSLWSAKMESSAWHTNILLLKANQLL